MKQIIKLALIGALVAFTAFAAYKTCATKGRIIPKIGQVPMTEEEQVQAIVKKYVNENMPEDVNKDIEKILLNTYTKKDGKVMTIEKEMAAEFFKDLNDLLPIKMTDVEIEDLAAQVKSANPTSIVRKFNTDGVTEITSKGYTAAHQAIFAIFPSSEPNDFVVSARYSKRSGTFTPIVTEVTERKCKKKWFGLKEECWDEVKRIETPRVVDDKLKAETATYLNALLLKDILEDKTYKYTELLH